MFIDIGAKNEAESCARGAGRPYEYQEFGRRMAKGKAFDDRVGCSLLVDLLSGDPPFPLFGVFTVQEEIGLRGARIAAYDVVSRLGPVLRAPCADIPGAEDTPVDAAGARPAIP